MMWKFILYLIFAFVFQLVVSVPVKRDKRSNSMSYPYLVRVQRSAYVQPLLNKSCQYPLLAMQPGCIKEVERLLQKPAPIQCHQSSFRIAITVFALASSNCSRQFYLCVDGNAYLEECPHGHYYNSSTKKCEPISHANCAPATTSTSEAPVTTTVAIETTASTKMPIETNTPEEISSTTTPTTAVHTTTVKTTKTTVAPKPSPADLFGTTEHHRYYPIETTTEYEYPTEMTTKAPSPSPAELLPTTTAGYEYPYVHMKGTTMLPPSPTIADLKLETTTAYQYPPYPQHKTALPTIADLETTTAHQYPPYPQHKTALPTIADLETTTAHQYPPYPQHKTALPTIADLETTTAYQYPPYPQHKTTTEYYETLEPETPTTTAAVPSIASLPVETTTEESTEEYPCPEETTTTYVHTTESTTTEPTTEPTTEATTESTTTEKTTERTTELTTESTTTTTMTTTVAPEPSTAALELTTAKPRRCPHRKPKAPKKPKYGGY